MEIKSKVLRDGEPTNQTFAESGYRQYLLISTRGPPFLEISGRFNLHGRRAAAGRGLPRPSGELCGTVSCQLILRIRTYVRT